MLHSPTGFLPRLRSYPNRTPTPSVSGDSTILDLKYTTTASEDSPFSTPSPSPKPSTPNKMAAAKAIANFPKWILDSIQCYSGTVCEPAYTVTDFYNALALAFRLGGLEGSTEATKLFIAKLKLSGLAKTVTESDPAFGLATTLDDFITLLRQKFAHVDQPQGNEMVQLWTLTQAPEETVLSFYSRLQIKAARVFIPGEDEAKNVIRMEYASQQLKVIFIQGLLPHLKEEVLKANPTTLENAYDVAIRMERLRKQAATPNSLFLSHISSPPTNSPTDVFVALGHISSQISELKETCPLCSKTDHKLGQCPQFQNRVPYAPRRFSNPRTLTSSPRNVHFSSPLVSRFHRPRFERMSSPPRRMGPPSNCRFCNRYHWNSECPNRRTNFSAPRFLPRVQYSVRSISYPKN